MARRTTTRSALVADASVIVKWFVKERFSEQSLRLRDSHVGQDTRIVVPTLARYEVLNALRFSGGFGTQELLRISRDLEGYQFLEIPLEERYAKATVSIATDYGITIYDSSYLAVGQVRNLPVFTADEKLLAKVDKLNFVRHVREYTP